uniref:Uncharacterized protein n=1 Tax=Fagus sylvatica TaxID=28930 RepID=A0A2N9EWX9_FAGSY
MERVKFNSLVSLRETLAAPSLPEPPPPPPISEQPPYSLPGSRGPQDPGRWRLDLDRVAHPCFASSLHLRRPPSPFFCAALPIIPP